MGKTPKDLTHSHGVNVRDSVWERVEVLAKKSLISPNAWVAKLITREAFKHGGQRHDKSQ